MRRHSFIYLVIGFSLTLIVMVVFTLIGYQRLNTMIRYSDQVEHTITVMEKIERLNSIVKDIETSLRGYVIARDSVYLEPLFIAKKQMPLVLDSLKLLVSDNEMQIRRLAMVRNTVLLRVGLLETSIPLINDGGYDSIKIDRMDKGRHLMESLKTGLLEMKTEEESFLRNRFYQKELYQRLTPSIFKQVTGLVGLVFLVLFILLVQALVQRYRFQQELEEQVQALKQSNADLTQLAFAASHDLQEPVRKIRTFGDRLLIKQKENLNDEGRMILSRIDFSAKRLQGMLEDISTYMNLVESEEEKEKQPLRKLVEEVVRSYEEVIKEKNAAVTIGNLPDLEVYPNQVRSLFRSLIDNSLKFSQSNVSPAIVIFSEQVDNRQLKDSGLPHLNKDYFAISIRDNGIGFDNEFRDKIFQLFRRLHTPDTISGKGIGLAICQRVMTNHNGFITADGKPGSGATFTVYFPRT